MAWLGMAAVAACTGPSGDGAAVVPLKVEVVASYPHDPTAFTQGLFFHEGKLFESTGLEGASSLRITDYQTGTVAKQQALPPDVFGEGLALAGGKLFQLTWQDGFAYTYALDDWAKRDQIRYDGEGWGLCFDEGKGRLVMSNGTPILTFRDPSTFEPTGQVTVTLSGQPVANLNELECVDGAVYANVWQTDKIVVIDPATGQVTGDIDAGGLLSPEERKHADVLNGIAYLPEKSAFFITGKFWPKLFEVKFVPREGGSAQP